MIAIVNTSPLIYLSQIGRIGLLRLLYSRVVTTPSVVKEVRKKKNAPELPLINEVIDDWLQVLTPCNKKLMKNLQDTQVIHEGEASILALALEMNKKNQIVILDDFVAREVAYTLDLKVIGTTGILLMALKRDFLPEREFKDAFTNLCERTSFRISVELYNEVLGEAKRISQERSNKKNQIF